MIVVNSDSRCAKSEAVMICEKVGFTVATSLARLFVSLMTTDLDRPAIFISHLCSGHRNHHCTLIARSKVGVMFCPKLLARVAHITIRLLCAKTPLTVLAASSTDVIRHYSSKSSSSEKFKGEDAADLQTAHFIFEWDAILICACPILFQPHKS